MIKRRNNQLLKWLWWLRDAISKVFPLHRHDAGSNRTNNSSSRTTVYSATPDSAQDLLLHTAPQRRGIAHPLDLNMIPVSDNLHLTTYAHADVSPQSFATHSAPTRRHTAWPRGSTTTAAGEEIKPSVTCNPTPAFHTHTHTQHYSHIAATNPTGEYVQDQDLHQTVRAANTETKKNSCLWYFGTLFFSLHLLLKLELRQVVQFCSANI